MGFFDNIQKPGFKANKNTKSHIRQETVRIASNPRRTPNSPSVQISKSRGLLNNSAIKENTVAKQSPKSRVQSSRKRPVATPQPLRSDSDDDVSDQYKENATKRARRSSEVEPDVNRQIRSSKAFSNEGGGRFSMVHASEIASISKPSKYKAAFPDHPLANNILLQYPSAAQRER